MTNQADFKDHPHSISIHDKGAAKSGRASSPRGRSKKNPVTDEHIRAAEDVMMGKAMIHLSPEDFDELLAEISGPAEPMPALVELFKRPAPWDPGYKYKPKR